MDIQRIKAPVHQFSLYHRIEGVLSCMSTVVLNMPIQQSGSPNILMAIRTLDSAAQMNCSDVLSVARICHLFMAVVAPFTATPSLLIPRAAWVVQMKIPEVPHDSCGGDVVQ